MLGGGGVLHGSGCVTVTLLPFLALTATQSSCNPRSFIHNSGCGSHWRQGGGGGGALGFSAPRLGWSGHSRQRQGRGLGEHLSLPPLLPPAPCTIFPLPRLPHAPPHQVPLFTRLFTAIPGPPLRTTLYSRFPYACPGQLQCVRGGLGIL